MYGHEALRFCRIVGLTDTREVVGLGDINGYAVSQSKQLQ